MQLANALMTNPGLFAPTNNTLLINKRNNSESTTLGEAVIDNIGKISPHVSVVREPIHKSQGDHSKFDSSPLHSNNPKNNISTTTSSSPSLLNMNHHYHHHHHHNHLHATTTTNSSSSSSSSSSSNPITINRSMYTSAPIPVSAGSSNASKTPFINQFTSPPAQGMNTISPVAPSSLSLGATMTAADLHQMQYSYHPLAHLVNQYHTGTPFINNINNGNNLQFLSFGFQQPMQHFQQHQGHVQQQQPQFYHPSQFQYPHPHHQRMAFYPQMMSNQSIQLSVLNGNSEYKKNNDTHQKGAIIKEEHSNKRKRLSNDLELHHAKTNLISNERNNQKLIINGKLMEIDSVNESIKNCDGDDDVEDNDDDDYAGNHSHSSSDTDHAISSVYKFQKSRNPLKSQSYISLSSSPSSSTEVHTSPKKLKVKRSKSDFDDKSERNNSGSQSNQDTNKSRAQQFSNNVHLHASIIRTRSEHKHLRSIAGENGNNENLLGDGCQGHYNSDDGENGATNSQYYQQYLQTRMTNIPRKVCDGCTKIKKGCIRNEEYNSCERCLLKGIKCTYSNQRKRGRIPKSDYMLSLSSSFLSSPVIIPSTSSTSETGNSTESKAKESSTNVNEMPRESTQEESDEKVSEEQYLVSNNHETDAISSSNNANGIESSDSTATCQTLPSVTDSASNEINTTNSVATFPSTASADETITETENRSSEIVAQSGEMISEST